MNFPFPGQSQIEHLYIHVPFCIRKCHYCAFASQPLTHDDSKRYLAALSKELFWAKKNLRPRTLFLGGGTPSCLDNGDLEKLFDLIQSIDLSQLQEFSIEINPATITPEKAALCRRAGVNRISIGAQSLNDKILRQLGRIHSAHQVSETVELLRETGFTNLNLDIIFGIPGQTLSELEETLNTLLELKTPHLSCYELTFEPGTPMTLQMQKSGFEPDEDLLCSMYNLILAKLAEKGIHRYEISNFARSGFECAHNIAYWRGIDYYGAGPSACSLIRGIRYAHPSLLSLYYNAVIPKQNKKLGLTSSSPAENDFWEPDQISPLARAGEIAAIGLRMSRGWDFNEFYAHTGFRLEKQWAKALQKLISRGDGEFFPGGFRLTDQGLRFADLAAEEFIITEEP